MVILSSPLIYACLPPFLLLDASVALYQLVCFPIYGIPKVRGHDYLVFDRGRLAYLNTIEKVGCIYCSYANGLITFVTEIAALTEQYFGQSNMLMRWSIPTPGTLRSCHTEMPEPTGPSQTPWPRRIVTSKRE